LVVEKPPDQWLGGTDLLERPVSHQSAAVYLSEKCPTHWPPAPIQQENPLAL